jgi:hypothetical protein
MKIYLTIVLVCLSFENFAQVAVREEPRHHPVIVNQYLRVLDVWIRPGDTTVFHIHATPSLFLIFTNTKVATQLKDSGWLNDTNIKGEVYFEEFTKERVHRVSNVDKDSFHVTDIEILSAYKPREGRKPLPYTLLFYNDKAFAYRITEINKQQNVSSRGPIFMGHVQGENVMVNVDGQKGKVEISPGKFLYLKPGESFHFSTKKKGAVNLVLFELK